jgi:hypothetical protein
MSGFQRAVIGAWTERLREQPVASARQALQLELTYDHPFMLGHASCNLWLHVTGQVWYDFVYRYQRGLYDDATVKAYEAGLLPREIDAALTVGPVRLSVGRAITNWGQGEVLSVLDLINPRDLREPGLTAPAELRVPVLMSRVELAFSRHRLQMLVVHEPSFGLLPPPLAPFSPMRQLLLETPVLGSALASKQLRYQHAPTSKLVSPSAQQYHARWLFSGDHFDAAIHAASLLDPLGIPSLPDPGALNGAEIAFEVAHPRYELLGFSGAVPFGDCVLRFEGSLSAGKPTALRRQGERLEIASARYNQLDGMIGLTYVVGSATTASVELSQGYLPENPARSADATWQPLWPVEATRIALRFDQALWRDRLRVGLIGLVIGLHRLNGWLARAEVSYALSDALHVQLQLITYQPSADFGLFYGFTKHDRAVLTVQWDFSS